jgi:hypothetical protein
MRRVFVQIYNTGLGGPERRVGRLFARMAGADPQAVLKECEAYEAGRKNVSFTIWRWLNLELWCRRFVDQPVCV